MADNNLGTRPRILHENETRNSLSGWYDSLLFHLSTENRFSRFLDDLSQWGPPSVPNRGFLDDPTEEGVRGLTAVNKATNLRLLLGYICIHCPVISSHFIKEEARSLDQIYNRLREHFDCSKSGAKITEILDFNIGPTESKECLWERIYIVFLKTV